GRLEPRVASDGCEPAAPRGRLGPWNVYSGCGWPRSLPVTRLPAGLLEQRDALDRHALLDGLYHVVDRERGDARCGQRLHLDAGLVHRTHACLDRENTAVVVAVRHVDTGETKRMAERDQLVGTLGRQDAGGARDAQHITLGRVAGTDDLKRLRRHTQDG